MGCFMSGCCPIEDEPAKAEVPVDRRVNTSVARYALGSDIKSEADNRQRLMERTYDNTEKFSFAGKVCKAKCVKVYDGDTITVVFGVYGDFYRFNVRMDGYDSPELKSRNPVEKKWAIESKNILIGLIMNRIVTLKCLGSDKYGRILGRVEYDGVDINEYMIKNGYCRRYDGGKKLTWDFSKFSLKGKST